MQCNPNIKVFGCTLVVKQIIVVIVGCALQPHYVSNVNT